ncbi:hypothetical protein NPIL_299001 [Nephila pilipes]|uniref:Uncharacterized protein n=1 Tax=Nephila pilipes TaxID=299642 RepID=A0A8X6MNL2_NEPPI|nr:hypothetical protein NPIL_299001 [Nephila pilipes]
MKISRGEGSVILTGIVKPHDEGEIAASAPSSSTSLDTLKAAGADNESVSGSNITRKAVSDINLKSASSLGNHLQEASHLKSSSTSAIGKSKAKDMAPTGKSGEKDVRK